MFGTIWASKGKGKVRNETLWLFERAPNETVWLLAREPCQFTMLTISQYNETKKKGSGAETYD